MDRSSGERTFFFMEAFRLGMGIHSGSAPQAEVL
jgi:hypothetical protein